MKIIDRLWSRGLLFAVAFVIACVAYYLISFTLAGVSVLSSRGCVHLSPETWSALGGNFSKLTAFMGCWAVVVLLSPFWHLIAHEKKKFQDAMVLSWGSVFLAVAIFPITFMLHIATYMDIDYQNQVQRKGSADNRCAAFCDYASFEPKHLREYILPEGAREIRCCVDKASGMICVSCTVDAVAFSSFSKKNGYAYAKMETACYLPSNDAMNELYPLRENLRGYAFANIEKSNVGETDMLEGVSIYDLERKRLYLAVCDKERPCRVD